MNLLSFFSKKKPEVEYYFGLFLKNDEVVGFVFEAKDNAMSIKTQVTKRYTKGWDGILEDMDDLISKLEASLNTHVTNTIFFLHSYLIDSVTQEIKAPYKDIIKNISKGLELKPLGFIELHEGVKEYVRERDEAPINAILVDVDSNHLSVYAYKGDTEMLAKNTPRSHSIPEDIQDILIQENNSSHFPSRIIVFGSDFTEEPSTSIQNFTWKTQLFIQPPKVEYLGDDELYKAMKKIFAEQIFQNPTDTDTDNEVPAQELPQTEGTTNAVLGFAIGEDVALKDEYKEPEQPVVNQVIPIMPEVATMEKDSYNEVIPPLTSSKPKFSMPTIGFSLHKGIIIAFIFIILLVSAVGAFEYFLHKVELEVFLPSKAISKSIDVDAAIGKKDQDFYVNEETVTLEITNEKKTTGERDIGQKAKGELMIHNFDNQEKVIVKGTKVTFNNVEFVLDQEVKVASSSGVTSSGTKQSGKSKVSATAVEIGPEANVEKGKELKIADLPSSLYVAIVEESFTGGTKKKVQTVAKKDLDTLETQAIAKAKTESSDKVKENVKSGQAVLGAMTKVDLSETEYTKEVGEESGTVAIKAKAEIQYYTFPEEIFKKEIADELETEVPAGYKLQTDKLEYKVEDSEIDEAGELVKLKIQATDEAVKEVSSEELIKSISGKTNAQLHTILKEKFEAEDVEIKQVSPSISIFGNWMPFMKQNIKVTISSR